MSEGAATLLGALTQDAGLTASRPEAFEAAYTEYKDLVRRVAFNLGGGEDLDDIVQETFVKLWRHWESFRGQSSRKTWVYRVTVNTARDHWRKRGRNKAFLVRYLADGRRESHAGEQASWEDRQAVAQAMEALGADLREAVTLVYLEGLSLFEAAEAMSCPLGTVKSRLHSARHSMAEFIEKRGGS